MPVVPKPSPFLPAVVAGNVQVYTKLSNYQNYKPRQNSFVNWKQQLLKNPPGEQDEKSSPVFFGLSKRAYLLENCSSTKNVYPLKYLFHYPLLYYQNKNAKC